MEDKKIIDLFYDRAEAAISATDEKYHSYCKRIVYNILENSEDAEECVSDTWLKAWNCIPPYSPENLATFLGKITRNTALNYLRDKSRKKRSNGQMELEECVAHAGTIEQEIAKHAQSNEGKIKSMLFRTRKKLKSYLKKEGYYVGE